jgi:hypothetical protein
LKGSKNHFAKAFRISFAAASAFNYRNCQQLSLRVVSLRQIEPIGSRLEGFEHRFNFTLFKPCYFLQQTMKWQYTVPLSVAEWL